MGGGEYDRAESFISETVDLRISGSLQVAIDQLGVDGGTIEVDSNAIFFEAPAIHLDAPGKRVLELRAADGRRPIIDTPSGEIVISGSSDTEVTLNGLVIAGPLRIPLLDSNGDPNGLKTLRLIHCTLVPGEVPAVRRSLHLRIRLDQCSSLSLLTQKLRLRNVLWARSALTQAPRSGSLTALSMRLIRKRSHTPDLRTTIRAPHSRSKTRRLSARSTRV
jgi:hypothetical protein